jgi:Domain of unknown function (DUF4190)
VTDDLPRYASPDPGGDGEERKTYLQPQQPPPPQGQGHDPRYWGHGPYQPPPYGPMPAVGGSRDHGKATLALALGIGGLATGVLLVSPVAWWFAHQAREEIDAEPGVYGNRGMATAGLVMGIIGTVALGIVVAALVVIVVTALAVT